MAKKGVGSEANYAKIGLLVLGLVGFLGWRFMSGGFALPNANASAASTASSQLASSIAPIQPVSVPVEKSPFETPGEKLVSTAIETLGFMDYLLGHYRPRLSISAYSEETGFFGHVDFYDGSSLVERYPISALHALGVALIHRPYGADLVYNGKSFIVTSWSLAKSTVPSVVVSDLPFVSGSADLEKL